MIHLMVRYCDGSLGQRAQPCPEVIHFQTWDLAGRWAVENARVQPDLGVIMVEFTGKHAKEAREHRRQVATVP